MNRTAFQVYGLKKISVPTSMSVSNSGTSLVNGTYIYVGISNGRNSYRRSTISGNITIFWNGSTWFIQQNWDGRNMYYSTDDVITPNLTTSWAAIWGVTPFPTIVEA